MRDEGRDNANSGGGSEARQSLAATILPMALFGLYTFVLMSTGVQGDAAFAGKDVDVPLYNAREGLLLAGFLLYGVVSWRRPRMLLDETARFPRIMLAALYVCCALVLQMAPFGIVLILAVMAMSLLVGFAGGAVYEKVALLVSSRSAVGWLASREESGRQLASVAERGQLQRDATTRMLGVVVGAGGMLAVVAQYLLQLELSLGGWFVALLAVCFCVLMYLMGAVPREHTEASKPLMDARTGAAERKQVLYLAVVVVCLFALFPFYEVAIRDAFTWVVFYQWHRLFLAVGYLVIGAAAFFGGRPAMSLAVAVAALFTAFVLTQTALLQVDNFTMALFYTLLGAVISYSGIAFMSLAPQTARPALVASAGRIFEAAVTIVGGALSLISGWPVSAVLLSALVLIALTIAFMVRGGFFTPLANADLQGMSQGMRDGANANGEGLLIGAGGPSTSADGQSVNADDASVVPEKASAGAGGMVEAAEDQLIDASQLAAIAERYGLTRRETEVLNLVFRDLTAQQMADELVVTKSTVKFHVTNILKKTGAETRQQLLEKLADEMKPGSDSTAGMQAS